MSGRDPEADAVFRDILASYAQSPAMAAKRMFGSDALTVEGKIACFVGREGRLVAKLPPATSERLLAAGRAALPPSRGAHAYRALPLLPREGEAGRSAREPRPGTCLHARFLRMRRGR